VTQGTSSLRQFLRAPPTGANRRKSWWRSRRGARICKLEPTMIEVKDITKTYVNGDNERIGAIGARSSYHHRWWRICSDYGTVGTRKKSTPHVHNSRRLDTPTSWGNIQASDKSTMSQNFRCWACRYSTVIESVSSLQSSPFPVPLPFVTSSQ